MRQREIYMTGDETERRVEISENLTGDETERRVEKLEVYDSR
jgi:hypothetical protein